MADISEELIEMAKEIPQEEWDALKCTWTFDVSENCWNTGCKEPYAAIEGAPLDNRIKFCCYCGKPIKEKKNAELQRIR